MSESVGKINLDLGLNYNNFNKEMSGIAGKAEGMASGTFGKLGRTIATAFTVTALVAFGKKCITIASDLQEVQNVVDVTFGDMSQQVDDFSQNALKSFGLSELSAKKYTSTLGAMFKSSGLTGQSIVTMSENLTGLAGDISSFYNLDTEDAFYKIQAGISGEIEPLRRLGINMSVANMEAYALSQGITKSYDSMTQGEQTILRYKYLMSVTKDSQGDFARTIGSWANQVRLLSSNFKIFMGTIGAGLMNLFAPALQVMNYILSKLQILAQYFKVFTEVLTGVSIDTSKVTKNSTGNISAVDSGIKNVDNSIKNVGTTAKKVANEIKGALAGFDQLNILNSKTGTVDNGGSGVGGIGSGIGGTSMPSIDTSGATKKAKDDMSNFAKQLKKIIDDIRKYLKDNFGAAFADLGKSIKDLYNSLSDLWELIKPFIIPAVKFAITTAIEAATKAINAFVKIFAADIEIISGIIDIVVGVFTLNREKVVGGFKKIDVSIKTLTDFAWALSHPFEALIKLVISIFTPKIKKAFENLKISISDAWGKAMNYINSRTGGALNTAVAAATKIKNSFIGAFNGLKSAVASTFNSLYSAIRGPINRIVDGINNSLAKIKITIPGWVPWYGGDTFSIPKIPRMAKGGIIDQPTLAMIGETHQKEAVVPLEDTSFAQSLANTIATTLYTILQPLFENNNQNNNASNIPVEVVLKLNETELGRQVVKIINDMSRRAGKSVLEV